MGDFDEIETDILIRVMCDLVTESRQLAKRNDAVVAEYERLRDELERRGGLTFAAAVGRGGIC
jgi:hypothetical protein